MLSGAGKNFCAGIDLDSLTGELEAPPSSSLSACDGRRRAAFRAFVLHLQAAMSAFEECPVPVVAAIHGNCIGAGIDMITACDIRLATADATFSVKARALPVATHHRLCAHLPQPGSRRAPASGMVLLLFALRCVLIPQCRPAEWPTPSTTTLPFRRPTLR